MNIKALRRRHDAARISTQLTHAGRSRRQLPSVRPVTGADQLVGRWTLAADGRVILAWGVERPRARDTFTSRLQHS
jgi:hypothetical protein